MSLFCQGNSDVTESYYLVLPVSLTQCQVHEFYISIIIFALLALDNHNQAAVPMCGFFVVSATTGRACWAGFIQMRSVLLRILTTVVRSTGSMYDYVMWKKILLLPTCLRTFWWETVLWMNWTEFAIHKITFYLFRWFVKWV